jgi:hypothetical protein
MQIVTQKKWIFSIALSTCVSCAALADIPPRPTGSSNAIAFAIEAGSIAGASQACGQDVSIFSSRIAEAIDRLAASPADKIAAMADFQHALQQAQATQSANHTIPCQQVMQDYHSLPIMRPDYQQTVISQLSPGMTGQAQTVGGQPPPPPGVGEQPPILPQNNAVAPVAPSTQNPQNLSMPPATPFNGQPQPSTVPALPSKMGPAPVPVHPSPYDYSQLPGGQQHGWVSPNMPNSNIGIPPSPYHHMQPPPSSHTQEPAPQPTVNYPPPPAPITNDPSQPPSNYPPSNY